MLGNLFEKLKNGLSKTKDNLTDRVSEVLNLAVKIDDELYEELEEILITADVGVETSIEIIDRVKDKVKEKKIRDPKEVYSCLKEVLVEVLSEGVEKEGIKPENTPHVMLVIGVNGAGKTTSIGKISSKLKQDGYKVIMAAADTFRAAAIEQLEVWSNRAAVDIIRHQEGSDPGAVVFDAIQASKARKADVLICDTAGRLHNKKNLMNELEKINRIIDREYSEASKEILLVLDGTTGQNALQQAKQFTEVCPIDGIVLTKLDGTAKGGVVIAIKHQLDIPVKLIGVGEGIEDLQEFKAEDFVEALF
ncbi:signal recognition particle-docking protein FtsY [Clostridium brassicae]|uniref:Signal recognition particle receptor FtsY n=1 Tax=Clostridium brassicae TaxID=2999072 RepID=A0ABT4DB08_9CLOT|nr:signal recognition particle-docking protein FtsY [Clostridium brassicae]MCY6959499.1 signal recognition particle-docking protein FtsY [Clostridium brassicae]